MLEDLHDRKTFSELADIVRRRREELELSRERLAAKAGLSTSTIVRIERGHEPKLDNLRALAAALDLPLTDLLTPAA